MVDHGAPVEAAVEPWRCLDLPWMMNKASLVRWRKPWWRRCDTAAMEEKCLGPWRQDRDSKRLEGLSPGRLLLEDGGDRGSRRKHQVPAEANASTLQSMDVLVKQMELQLQTIKAYIKAETEALPKARAMADLVTKQRKKLLHMFEKVPSDLPGVDTISHQSSRSFAGPAVSSNSLVASAGAKVLKERKGKAPPPRHYITEEELASLSSYMRGRVSIEKINAAIDEMALLAEANSQLVSAPRKKLGEDIIEKVLELRDIASSDPVKGKYFFLESDMKGPVLRMDTTGKSILTIFRHVGRISEFRIGRQRVFVITNSQP